MGIFKQMKDLKDMTAAAPGLVEQAQQMAESAQQMAAQHQQAAMQQQQVAMQQAMGAPAAAAPAAAPTGAEPIAGVDLGLYAQIVRAIAPLGYDQSLLPGIAASHGIDAAAWQQAHDGWNARIQADPAVARAFSDLYRAP